ncbi:sigma-E factor negative regulatory protein [Pseudothauera lacus]|uniref:Anti-sigma 24 factor n=1 Tax=Pseudothauera lacus TaxID=2136175 RepID=A0A2T4IJE6_9RHOO|nr:sigma-E factor negative regulatory protein [Pseudothauera lacus]PTD97898.1 anti-sigma 24 factor [Pseudothauera lacus]
MKDKLSTLLDGELDEGLDAPLFENLKRTPGTRAEWDAWCLIGDVLRGDQCGAVDFTARVMARLDDEPTVLAPVLRPPARERNALRESLMPLAASVMGVAAVGWVAHTLWSAEQTAGLEVAAVPLVQVAERPLAVVAPAAAVVEFRQAAQASQGDPHREYVFVHQAMTGGGPLPGAVQYVRTVSDLRREGGR